MIADEIAHFLHDSRAPLDVNHWAHRLRIDPMFATEMRVCREWRISHSEFLSWPTLDREKAVAYVIHEGRRCKDCGIHPEDWPYETDDPPYTVEAKRCFGCLTINEWMDDYRKGTTGRDGEPDPKAMWGLRTHLRPTASE